MCRSETEASMDDIDYAGWNDWVVGEFRSKDGQVPGYEEIPLLLLTTTGHRSGEDRVVPLGYLRIDDCYFLAATNSGRPQAPAWLGNLRTERRARIEVGTESLPVVAEELSGPRLTEIWRRFADEVPTYAGFVRDDPFPIVMLTRAQA
jgi:deazaflavin-dependent oxidoreductase (nitroreductase family)